MSAAVVESRELALAMTLRIQVAEALDDGVPTIGLVAQADRAVAALSPADLAAYFSWVEAAFGPMPTMEDLMGGGDA